MQFFLNSFFLRPSCPELRSFAARPVQCWLFTSDYRVIDENVSDALQEYNIVSVNGNGINSG